MYTDAQLAKAQPIQDHRVLSAKENKFIPAPPKDQGLLQDRGQKECKS